MIELDQMASELEALLKKKLETLTDKDLDTIMLSKIENRKWEIEAFKKSIELVADDPFQKTFVIETYQKSASLIAKFISEMKV